MLLFTIAIIIGFILLIWGADRFVAGAANIAKNLGVSPLIIGVSIVGFGTSAPEMLVSGLAAFQGQPALGIGNALGSNITNIGLVLGVTLLISPLTIHKDTLRREFPLLGLAMLTTLLLLIDGSLSRIDGLILLSGLILFLLFLCRLGIKDKNNAQEALEDEVSDMSQPKAWFNFLLGLIVLLVGSEILIKGAVGIAHLFGISELIIGLTVVAIGTSLPELATSIISVIKKEHDIAVGNVLGSNIFNLLAVLAMPGLIKPSQVDPNILYRDIPIMIGITVLFYLFSVLSPQHKVGRFAGLIILLVYIAYNILLGYQSIT